MRQKQQNIHKLKFGTYYRMGLRAIHLYPERRAFRGFQWLRRSGSASLAKIRVILDLLPLDADANQYFTGDDQLREPGIEALVEYSV